MDSRRPPPAPTSPTDSDGQSGYWNPAPYLRPESQGLSEAPPYVMLLLNQPIVDKRLFDALEPEERKEYIPRAICGDLDSLRASVRQYYVLSGAELHENRDQDSTDFGKCLRYIRLSSPARRGRAYKPPLPPGLRAAAAVNDEVEDEDDIHPIPILVYSALSGRVDQAFHTMHQLHLLSTPPNPQLMYLISEDSLTFLLAPLPTVNVLSLPRDLFGQTCGILPVGSPSVITTAGLVWDVKDWETRFGGRVSTSNHLRPEGGMVEVRTTERVVFTVEVKVDGVLGRVKRD